MAVRTSIMCMSRGSLSANGKEENNQGHVNVEHSLKDNKSALESCSLFSFGHTVKSEDNPVADKSCFLFQLTSAHNC